MQGTTIAALAAGVGISALATGRALGDDYRHRLRTVDAGEYQHTMFAAGGVAAAGLLSTIVLAVAHARGASGVAGAAAGMAAGLGIGMVGTVLATRLLRDPDGHVQQEWTG